MNRYEAVTLDLFIKLYLFTFKAKFQWLTLFIYNAVYQATVSMIYLHLDSISCLDVSLL